MHERAADGKEDGPVRAQPVLRLVGPPDGDREAHDHSVSQEGVYDKAVEAIRAAKQRGFRVNINCTLFNDAQPERVAAFFDTVKAMGVDGITVSPGYAYERAPDQQHFLNRGKTKQLFRDILSRGRGKKWSFSQSTMFLDFLAGNQTYHCTPWGNPARTVFGWQRPCYLVGEGYVKTFKELMETTDWDAYGTGNYEKCADCMVHSGYEATAVADTFAHPLKALGVSLRGVRTDGPMAPDIPRQAASRRVRVLAPRRDQAGRDRPRQAVQGRQGSRQPGRGSRLRTMAAAWPTLLGSALASVAAGYAPGRRLGRPARPRLAGAGRAASGQRAQAAVRRRAAPVREPLAGLCRQTHPCYQIVFGVRDAADPAIAVVERLRADFPPATSPRRWIRACTAATSGQQPDQPVRRRAPR